MYPGIVIRKEQMDALRSLSLDAFESDMVEHVRKYFPNHYRIAGDPVVRNMIRLGIIKARSYGLTTQRNVALYITVIFMLGGHFDEDFMFPELRSSLTTQDNVLPSVRADRVADLALEFQRKIAGPQNRSMNRAFLTLRKEKDVMVEDSKSNDFETIMLGRLRHIFASKYDAFGESLMTLLVNQGLERSEGYGIAARPGKSLFIILMFILGTHFDRDPFFPWIREILTDDALVDENQKIQRLHRSSVEYLDRWLEKMEIE